MSNDYQVAIIGGGPVGVAMAIELALRGISCVLVERRTEIVRIPKGQNLVPRTLEHFWRWGIEDALRAQRIMPQGFSSGAVTAYRTLSSEYWYDRAGREILSPYFFRLPERLPQYCTEAVLRDRARTLPGISFRFGWAMESIEQDEQGVRVAIVEQGGAGRETISADYAVGCDGSHSKVRESIGITRGGADYDQLMMLAVFRSPEFNRYLDRFPPRSTYNALTPELNGFWQLFGRVDPDESFFFHAPVPSGTTRENYDFAGLIQRAAGFPFAAEFDHVGFWDLRISVAEKYRVGRVFIAGDAAHSHPPYGGYGLNSGLEDVVNLGWKLAALLQGWGGGALADSYGDERQPIFKETGEKFIDGRILSDRRFLERYSPERDRAEFTAAWAGGSQDSDSWMLDYDPHYEGSTLVFGPEGGQSGVTGKRSLTARPGRHLAPHSLSDGRKAFEALGPGFTLFAFGAPKDAAQAFAAAAERLGVPLTIVRDSFAGGGEAYGARLILVRPDQFVAWVGDHAPDALAIMRKVSGS